MSAASVAAAAAADSSSALAMYVPGASVLVSPPAALDTDFMGALTRNNLGTAPVQALTAAADATAPIYRVFRQVPHETTKPEQAAMLLLRSKIEGAPYGAYVTWFSAARANAMYNWVLRPKHIVYPTTPDQPLPDNPWVNMTLESYNSRYGKQCFKFTMKAHNTRTCRPPVQQSNGVWAVPKVELAIEWPHMVQKTGRIGPMPHLVFQSTVFEGVPLSPTDHTEAWTQDARRPYDMHTAYREATEFAALIEEEFAAWLARMGTACPVTQIAMMAQMKLSPTQLYLRIRDQMRQHMPLVRHPCELVKNGRDFQEKPGTEQPHITELQIAEPMMKGEVMWPKEDRQRALQTVRYDKQRPMCAEHALMFLRRFGQEYVPINARRARLVALRTEGLARPIPELRYEPLTLEEQLTLFGKNAVVQAFSVVTFRLNQIGKNLQTEWFHAAFALRGLVYYGRADEIFGAGAGYSGGAATLESATTLSIEDPDVMRALAESRDFVAQPSAPRLLTNGTTASSGATDEFADLTTEQIDEMYANVDRYIEAKSASVATAPAAAPVATEPAAPVAMPPPAPSTVPPPPPPCAAAVHDTAAAAGVVVVDKAPPAAAETGGGAGVDNDDDDIDALGGTGYATAAAAVTAPDSLAAAADDIGDDDDEIALAQPTTPVRGSKRAHDEAAQPPPPPPRAPKRPTKRH